MEKSALCPDCGGVLASEPAIQGLSPQCLLSLALEESELEGQKTLDGTAEVSLVSRNFFSPNLGKGSRFVDPLRAMIGVKLTL